MIDNNKRAFEAIMQGLSYSVANDACSGSFESIDFQVEEARKT